MSLSEGLKPPVIVMGMAQCGTTLLAEMVHRGGTPMYAGDLDPSYDSGIKYERPLCHRINRLCLGVPPDSGNPHSTTATWTWPLKHFPIGELDSLRAEVGDGPWGFKDPRTTHTYAAWLEAFPTGPRLYSYRGHNEYLRRSLRSHGHFSLNRARKHLRAWIAFNEAVVRNCRWDDAAGRPWALVYYDELMENPDIIRRLEAATGVPLYDARRPELRRTRPAATDTAANTSSRDTVAARERLFIAIAEIGRKSSLRRVYGALEALRLSESGSGVPTPPSPLSPAIAG